MMRTNLRIYTILVLFAHFVIQPTKITASSDDIFSIISDTVLERQTEYEFNNSEAARIDPNSTETACLKCMFRQYLYLATEEMDKRSRFNSQNTSKADANLHLDAVYFDISNNDYVQFNHIICDVSQFKKLSKETQIIITNENTKSFVNRFRGTMPWLTFAGLVENNDVSYNFIFNITAPMLREEYEVAQNNEGNMKIKSKSEVFTFDDFILGVTINSTNNDETYDVETTTLQQLENRTDETNTYDDANNSINGSLVHYSDVMTKNVTVDDHYPINITGTSRSGLQIKKILEQIRASKAKLLGRLADTWLISIVDYLNEKYVKSKILAGNQPLVRICKMNLFEELCNNLIPNAFEIPNFEVLNNTDRADLGSYCGYAFSQVRIDDLKKFVKCSGFDYPAKRSRLQEIDRFAKLNFTFIYEYSPETEYRSLLNWTVVKKGKVRSTNYNYDSENYDIDYYPNSEMQNNISYINMIIIELSIRTNESRQSTDDPVEVGVKFNMSSSNVENVSQNNYREKLLPYIYNKLIEIIKSRIKF